MLNFESPAVVTGIPHYAVYWITDDSFIHYAYVNTDGKLYHHKLELTLGSVVDFTILRGTLLSADKNIRDLKAIHLPGGKVWFTWIDAKGGVKQAIWEDEPIAGEALSPYKLYYAVDTEKLYMNIEDTWEFVGSPNIAKLNGYIDIPVLEGGGYDLSSLVDRIQSVENAVGTNTAPPVINLYSPEHSVAGYMPANNDTLVAPDAVRNERTSEYIQVNAGEMVTIQCWVTPVGPATTDYLWMAYKLYDANNAAVGSRTALTPSARVDSNGVHHRSISVVIPDGVYALRISARMYADGKLSVVKTIALPEWN